MSVEQRFGKVEAVIFDVDGVLTDGSVIYGPGGEWKRFNVHDGHGFKLARRAGLKLALLTGRSSEAVERRASELGVDVLRQGALNKARMLDEVLAELDVHAEKVCYVGDDVVDIPAMRRVGMPVAVANAVEEVKKHAIWITEHRGGEGAAREVLELILRVKGVWRELLRKYLED